MALCLCPSSCLACSAAFVCDAVVLDGVVRFVVNCRDAVCAWEFCSSKYCFPTVIPKMPTKTITPKIDNGDRAFVPGLLGWDIGLGSLVDYEGTSAPPSIVFCAAKASATRTNIEGKKSAS